MDLRYRLNPDDEQHGSNLIGRFAVRRSDGAVFDYDDTDIPVKPEDAVKPLAPRPPFEK